MVLEENIGVYEGLFILDANAYARDHDGLAQEVNGLIEAAGGHIEVSRLWEERRLAYPIKGHRKGAYWITYFRMPTSNLTGLTPSVKFRRISCGNCSFACRELWSTHPGARPWRRSRPCRTGQ